MKIHKLIKISIIQTDEFYILKILNVKDVNEESDDDRQGKMLLHTEHSLLSLLSGQPGVIQHHGLFQVIYCELFMLFFHG